MNYGQLELCQLWRKWRIYIKSCMYQLYVFVTLVFMDYYWRFIRMIWLVTRSTNFSSLFIRIQKFMIKIVSVTLQIKVISSTFREIYELLQDTESISEWERILNIQIISNFNKIQMSLEVLTITMRIPCEGIINLKQTLK